MKKKIFALLPLFFFLIAACITVPHSYYISPVDINANSYHSIPMRGDSIKHANYAGAGFMAGPANYHSRDYYYGFQASLHRAVNFGHFQAFYGTGIMLGSYHVDHYAGYYYRYPRLVSDTVLRLPASNRFFSALGFTGGVNYVISFDKRFEWRVLGLETSFQHEFGSYLNFRKSLKDSVTNALDLGSNKLTLGWYSELVWKNRRGTEFGIKIGSGGYFVNPDSYRKDSSSSGPFYFSNTFHVTVKKVSGFMRFATGDHCSSFQTGVQYRFGRQ